ncbi:DUF2288 domain-containing protein [Romeria aff. gracilis LEGE 07310]|uniref:DUF2288 domain-containing protein n=1 Tax=Vasconcelosia minhoensis LEGE 07310 TaxID=915328 RepID=A0A8J7ATI4_9CYAN|nr:DUF2288 domain-containing protein [Romeria gracilis]MBE9076233.1 DUF2288 domain-containing protein [Romeria aff. gracilis LEGE 07310]
MTEDLRSELADMVGPAKWEWLKPHVQRDAVVVVDQRLDLVEVGVAIATDDVQSVQRWIGEQLIIKPTAEQLAYWGGHSDKRFSSLIVQPYVLVQDSSMAA